MVGQLIGCCPILIIVRNYSIMKCEKVLMGKKLLGFFTSHNRWSYLGLSLLMFLLLAFSSIEKGQAQSLTEQTGANNPLDGVDLGTENNPAIGDLDDDGDWDMLVGQDDGTVDYFLNTGSSTAPTLVQQTGAANPMNGEDVGVESRPFLWDIDNDGDFDLFIGEDSGDVVYYENTGSASSPTFTRRNGANNPFNGVDIGSEADITFGDIDNDGDADAFIGESNGNINYFENTGTVSSPTFTQRTGANNPINGEDVGSESAPTLYDFDNDGDYDMFVGDNDGDIHYFENTGTAVSPAFTEVTGAGNPFNGIDFVEEPRPHAIDLNGDGYSDIVVSNRFGTFRYFTGTNTGSSPIDDSGLGPALDMAYTTSAATQNETSAVVISQTDAEIIGIEVYTIGSANAIDLTSLNLSTAGSTNASNDISNAKVYYTGNVSAFSTANQFGTTSANPNGAFTVNGTQTLNRGVNYFWLAYDIDAGATLANVVDAQVSQITVDGSNETPTVTNPSGSRSIISGDGSSCTLAESFSVTCGSTITLNENTTGKDTGTNSDCTTAGNAFEKYWYKFTGDGNTIIATTVNIGSTLNDTKIWVYSGSCGALTCVAGNDDINFGTLYSSVTFPTTNGTEYYIVVGGFNAGDVGTFELNVTSCMAYTSSTSTQNTLDVSNGSTDEQIIGLEIVTTGSTNALDATSFTFNTTGSTNASNDISNAKLYYTGTTGTFATTTQIGSTSANPNGTFTINGTATLSEGTNYFWLAYDISGPATPGNVVDAQVTQITVEGSNYTPTITSPAGSRTIVEAPVYASFPYYTSFETGFFEEEWQTSSTTANGRIQVTTTNTPRTGNYHVSQDVSVDNTYNGNNLDLYIDLQGQTDVELEFYFKHFGEEDDNVDGIYLSDDGGATFSYAYEVDPDDYVDNIWNRIVLDIDALATTLGLSLNNTFVIRFYQYDNYPITDDGILLDDISVRNSACNSPNYVTLPYYEGFESGILDAEWCTTINAQNRTTITSNNTPYVGTYHLTMDVINDNVFDTNEASLHLDLSGETQVELSFYFKDFGDEDQNVDGIYLSDDGGANFSYVHEIDPTAYVNNTWNNITLDIDALAAGAGLSLTSTFVIRFLQYDNYRIDNDGMAFDEIQVYSNATNWIGGASTAWNTAANWSNGVPDCTTLVTIPDVSGASGNFPQLGAGADANVGDIIIQSGANVSISTGFTVNVCGNWNNYGSATLGTGTVVFQGTNIQEITGVNTFQNLTINNNGSFVRLVDDQTVNGALTLTDGIVNTNFNTLSLGTAATTSGASNASFVDGPLTKIGNSDFEFPVGDGTTWAPIAVANLTGDAATQFTAEYYETKYGDTDNLRASDPNGDLNNVSLREYWDLDNTGTASNADVTLYWKDQSGSGINNYTDLQISHYTGSEWENLGQSAIASNDPGWIRVTGVSSFSPFSFGSTDGSNPLPVELVTFTATEKGNNVMLDWQTASELNNDFFEIQRSEDGEAWDVIGQVAGNGTINEVVNYSYVDIRPLYGTSYYRLRQVDFDGRFEYSNIESVNFTLDKDQIEVSIYPNPTSDDNINIRLLTPNRRNKVKLKMVDISGKLYLDQTVEAEKFSQDIKVIPDRALNSGIYILEVTQDQMTSKHKIIIL